MSNINDIPVEYIQHIMIGLQFGADINRKGNNLNKYDYGVITLKSLITSWEKNGDDWRKENESNIHD